MSKTSAAKTVYVAQVYGEENEHVYQLIRSAAADAGFAVTRAEAVQSSKISYAEAVNHAVVEAAVVVAYLSGGNETVMRVVGFAQAIKKPIVLVAGNSRSIPFDLAGSPAVFLDSRQPTDFLDRLSDTLRRAVSDPGLFVQPSDSKGREDTSRVFISYSHTDREYLDRLLVHLTPLQRDGLLELWADTHLRAGDKWNSEIEKALSRATVAVLLVSADFLASDFIARDELPPLLKSAEERGARVIPVIVKPCRFNRDKHLRHFQAINTPERALVLLPSGQQELVYDQLASEIERWVQHG